jgi:hypothetical protein
MHQVHLSVGELVEVLDQTRQAMQPMLKSLRVQMRGSVNLHIDETGWRETGRMGTSVVAVHLGRRVRATMNTAEAASIGGAPHGEVVATTLLPQEHPLLSKSPASPGNDLLAQAQTRFDLNPHFH